MPKVSIIIPVYNVEEYISRCIESVQLQTLEDVEIVIVNDCTPDKSMDIVRKYAETDERIRIVEHDINHGLMMARRTGYMTATGDYIVFLDSDDWFPPNAIEILYKTITTTESDIIIASLSCCDQNGNSISVLESMLKYGSDRESVFKALLKRECYHSLCGKIFRKSLFENIVYETRNRMTNSEDAMLFYQIVDKSNKIACIPDSVYCYYQNTNSSSKVKLKENALRGMVVANITIQKIISKYKSLRVYLEDYLYYSTFSWILVGSQNYYLTWKILHSYKMHKYLSLTRCLLSGHFNMFYFKAVVKSIFLYRI